MIRKPIGHVQQIVLGVLSFCMLIVAYTQLSSAQYKKNPSQMTTPGWTKNQQVRVVESSLERAKTQLEHAESTGDAEAIDDAKSEIRRLEAALKQVNDGYYKSLLSGFKKTFVGEDDEVGWLYTDSGVSLKRFGMGMLVGISLAFLTGIAMGCFTSIEAFVKPPVAFLASIPPTAMIAVYLVIFDLSPELFVAVIGVGIFPVLAQAIFQAVKNDVPETSVYKAYTLGASNLEVIWEVVVPQILPRIIDAIRLQIGPAMIFLIAVEWLYGSEGIGWRIKRCTRVNHFDVAYLYLIVLGIFGMLVDWGMTVLRRWLCPWFKGAS